MNSLSLLLERDLPPGQLAFYPLGGAPVHFGELLELARRAQNGLRELGFTAGHSLLLADTISAEFYAVVMAALGLGGRIVLVEPFLPVTEIGAVVDRSAPWVFVASFLGRLWGSRVRAIRKIPHWISARSLCRGGALSEMVCEAVHRDDPAIITFTSGTSGGRSKGVVRTHSVLSAQNRVIRTSGGLEAYSRPDLAIFANLTLANLGMGRGTVFVPPGWRSRHLRMIRDLPPDWQPETLSCGPAFLSRFLNDSSIEKPNAIAPHLKSIHVGGALSECSLFERAFQQYPETRFLQVYGSSEAEPVSFSDARVAVQRSKDRGYLQALFLGTAIPEIRGRVEEDSYWVSGPHVCGEYIGNDSENLKAKKRDRDGTLWHAMGDRLKVDSEGLWFEGRSFQDPADFHLEQKVYSYLGQSSCFVFRDSEGHRVLSGEGVIDRKSDLLTRFQEIQRIQEKKIIRDRRHRSRIDRGASQ